MRILRLSGRTLWTLEVPNSTCCSDLQGRGPWLLAMPCVTSQGLCGAPDASSCLTPHRQGSPAQSSICQNPGTIKSAIQKKISSFRSFNLDSCLISPVIQLRQFINYRAANVLMVGGGAQWAEKWGQHGGLLPSGISGSRTSNHWIVNGMLALGIRIKKIWVLKKRLWLPDWIMPL